MSQRTSLHVTPCIYLYTLIFVTPWSMLTGWQAVELRDLGPDGERVQGQGDNGVKPQFKNIRRIFIDASVLQWGLIK